MMMKENTVKNNDNYQFQIVIIAFVIRIFVILLGSYIDQAWSPLHFTDVDYWVFSDAAGHVAMGQSAYERPSYRYSPMLAWMLLGNIWIHPAWGKIIFAVFDVACLGEVNQLASYLAEGRREVDNRRWLGILYALNPFSIVICCRGSFDAVSTFLVLLTVRWVLQKKVLLAALVYGLLVHLRLYPIIYFPSLLLSLLLTTPTVVSSPPLSSSFFFRQFKQSLPVVILFFCVSLVVSVGLGVLCGEEYWEHAVFHHFHRIDHRHNFSVYSYLLYLLKSSGGTLPGYFSMIAFGLQALVLLGVALKWARSNLVLCLLLQTLVFVAFNKVATAQYFLWYLALIPLALRRDQLVKPYLLGAGGLWMASVGWWLRLGYEVEFQGQAAMRALWLAALFLLFAHVSLIMAIAKAAVE